MVSGKGIKSRAEGAFHAKRTSRGAELLRSEQSALLLRLVRALVDILDSLDPAPSSARVELRTILGELQGTVANATDVAWEMEDGAIPED